MRIRISLNIKPPVEDEHGITTGRVMETCDPPEGKYDRRAVWVMGDTGIPVKLWSREYTVVEGDDD